MANKTLNNVKINMTLKSTTTRAKLSTSSEDLAVQMGKINKWYDSLVPTGGASGNILGWNSDGTAKWVTVAPSANKLNVSSAVGGTSQPVYFKADGTPESISFTIEKSVPSTAVFTDEKVKSTLLAQSTAAASYRPTFVTGAATGGVSIINSYQVNHTPGTTSAVGNTRLVLGNSTASGTTNNEEGQIKLYSPGTALHTIKGATISSEATHVLPSTGGTILNDETTSYTQTVASSATGVYEIGKIKINGTQTTIYGKDTGATYSAGDHLSLSSTTFSLASYCKTITDWNEATTDGWYMGASVTNAPSTAWWFGRVVAHNNKYCMQEVWQFTASTDGHKVPHKMRMFVNNVWGDWVDITVGTQVPENAVFTDTKVTSSANHYTPSTASGSDKSASASGATAAWSIDVVKGVTLNTDGKGHVTGISVESGKIPANPVPSNNVTGSGTSGYLAKWNGTNTITNGPQLGSSTTTYLNNAGSWATPPDTKNTAGSTDTSSKIYLIGATSQAANPQTYSDNEVYTTSGVLTTKKVQVGGGACTMEYNSTTETLDFVFA